MKALLGIVLLWLLGMGCGGVAPECKGDPALISCSCMNPNSPQCPPVVHDAKRKKGNAK